MARTGEAISAEAAQLRNAIVALVDQAIDAGTEPREVFSGVALAFGKALGELIDPQAAAWFMQREATRVAALATPPTTGGVQ